MQRVEQVDMPVRHAGMNIGIKKICAVVLRGY
jgi:hypothetical protein